MLIGFKVKNYKSFKELQYFSMLAGKVRCNLNHVTEINDKKVLKFSGFYGANGSGKSNLISAIGIIHSLINGINNINDYDFYRGKNGDINANSYFEYELALNNKLYSYGFEINFNKKIIVSEWLIDMTKKKKKIIYERDITNGKYSSDILSKKYLNYKNCLEEMKSSNEELFLKEISRRLLLSNIIDDYFSDVLNVYKYLCNNMIIIKPTTHNILDIDLMNDKDKVLKYLNILDINISDIYEEKSSIEVFASKLTSRSFNEIMDAFGYPLNELSRNKKLIKIEDNLFSIEKIENKLEVNKILFKHFSSDYEFNAYEESDGTIRVLELLNVLFSSDKLFLLDELDSSLHPLLVNKFLRLFLESENNSQLIITTHESRTLDFDLIRRDEIWFSEKDKEGSSKIYSLEEYKDIARFDKKIDKAYLEGRFGAIPNDAYED